MDNQVIPYSRHTITGDDKRAVMAALDSDWIAGNGPIVREFEEAVAEYTGYKYAVAVNSATSGLHVALLTALAWLEEEGLKYSQIVIPALTFVATANAVLSLSKKVITTDVFGSLTNLSCHIPVSYAGYPILNSRKAIVVDDAHYLYPKANSITDSPISVISTHPVKPITTGEGGVILTNTHDIYDTALSISNHGYGQLGQYGYGLNFRMPSINAALGLSQLKRASDNLEWRKEIAGRYYAAFVGINKIELPPYHEHHAWHLFVLRMRGVDRDKFRLKLKAKGIGTQVHYRPLYLYDHIPKTVAAHPNTQDVWENGVSIPMFSGMTNSDVTKVINAVCEVLNE